MVKKQYLKTDNGQLKQKRILIFASGNGSNFEAIVKHFKSKDFTSRHSFNPVNIEIELITDKKDAPVIKKAKTLNIPYFYVKFEDLYDFLKSKKGYDLYVLAGYMRILPEKILKLGIMQDKSGAITNSNKFINIHPSLLPEFKGKDAIKRAFEAKKETTGVTVHFAEKKVDSGKIIAQKSVSTKGKTLMELEKAIHEIEHKIYPEIIENLLFKKNVLLYGGGAREHALAQKLLESPFLNKLYLANPGDGFKHLGKTVEFTNFSDLAKKARLLNIDLMVVGPENPLFEGITDTFKKENIKVIGADKKWAKLEGSKSYAKTFMLKNGIKTADYRILEDKNKIEESFFYFKEKYKTPPVIKADGAALGKGVYLPENFNEAKTEAVCFLDGKFGEASKKIVLEERLYGKEISLLSFWDGKNLASFPPAADYKRLKDNNIGPNTGGMGAIAPAKISKKEHAEIEEYKNTLKTALLKEKADFQGIIYSGLILTKNGVYVLEYNMRFGDPECQVLLELMENDLLYIFIKMGAQKLDEIDLKFSKKKAYCVVLASDGYPESPKKGAVIKNLDSAKKNGCKIYFAGVKTALNKGCAKEGQIKNKIQNQCFITNGGRVLSIVKSAQNGKSALNKIYKTADSIMFDNKIYRKDIGK